MFKEKAQKMTREQLRKFSKASAPGCGNLKSFSDKLGVSRQHVSEMRKHGFITPTLWRKFDSMF